MTSCSRSPLLIIAEILLHPTISLRETSSKIPLLRIFCHLYSLVSLSCTIFWGVCFSFSSFLIFIVSIEFSSAGLKVTYSLSAGVLLAVALNLRTKCVFI